MPYDFSMKLTSPLKRLALVATLALSLVIAIPTVSNAEPGRTWEIDIDAATYAQDHPSEYVDENWCGEGCQIPYAFYLVEGVSAGDTFTFNVFNSSNVGNPNFYPAVGYFKISDNFEISYTSDGEEVPYYMNDWNDGIDSIQGYIINNQGEPLPFNNLTMQMTLGSDPVIDEIGETGRIWNAGYFGFINGNQYYVFLLTPNGQWNNPSGNSGSAPLTYGNPNSYADPTGELRSLINQIKSLSGSLIGWK